MLAILLVRSDPSKGAGTREEEEGRQYKEDKLNETLNFTELNETKTETKDCRYVATINIYRFI